MSPHVAAVVTRDVIAVTSALNIQDILLRHPRRISIDRSAAHGILFLRVAQPALNQDNPNTKEPL
jgi:hypothetical protein